MTKRNRKALLAPKPQAAKVEVARHRVDGTWEPERTIFDSELFDALNEAIEFAMGHEVRHRDRDEPFDLTDALRAIGLTPAQTEVITMRTEGLTLSQTAELLHITRQGVANHLRAARAKVAETVRANLENSAFDLSS